MVHFRLLRRLPQRKVVLRDSIRGKYLLEFRLTFFLIRIDSAYMRQAVYTTARFGIFTNLSDTLKQRNGG